MEPCLTPPVAEEIGMEPREIEMLTDAFTELLALELDLELLALGVLTAGLLELFTVGTTMGTEGSFTEGSFTEGSFTELLALGMLTAGLLELFRVGIGMWIEGSFTEDELAFLDEEELVFFVDEDELSFLLEDEEASFLLEEDNFLLEATGARVTVDFLMVTGLVTLVNFKMLERVSFLLEAGLTAVDAFAVLEDFFELVLAFLVLLLTFLVLEGFLIEETLGMEMVVGLIVGALAVPETPTVTVAPAVTPIPSRGSRLSRRTLSATSPKVSSLLS